MSTPDNTGSMQRRLTGEHPMYSTPQHDEAATLRTEVDALRAELAAHEQLSVRLAQLREANEHLVMASVHADDRRDQAEEANRRQNEFLAMLAHELRNPLAPISMAATLLERIPEPPPQLANLRGIIRRQVDQMAHLLDDLLDAARVSSGKITLTFAPVLLSDVIERAVETVAPRIAERSQLLTVDVPEAALVIEGDQVRLTQVFANLLANASKYTHDGGAIALAAQPSGDSIRVTLSDNGVGMAPEVLPHVFDLFTQAPRSLARSEGGLGVGLNVVRKVVTLHGGDVWASSPGPGKGSVFTVMLPLAPDAELPDRKQMDGIAAASCSILLVEDNVDACTTLSAFLVEHGHAVQAVQNGSEGLQAALDGHFDVLVCDIGLPGIDGYALLRSLREQRGMGSPFAIGLSGYCQPENRQLALEAGFEEFMVKPVDANALLALIARIAPAQEQAPD